VSLSTLVEKIPDLLKLRLFCTRVDLDAARCLSTALKRNTDMKSLHLFQCNLESDREILSVILQSNVKAINLDRNNIDSCNTSRATRPLYNCHLVPTASMTIMRSSSLKHLRGTQISKRYLNNNDFTSVGIKTMIASLCDSTSLNAISESNHTCTLLHLFDSTASI
jgi:hypothetical protein